MLQHNVVADKFTCTALISVCEPEQAVEVVDCFEQFWLNEHVLWRIPWQPVAHHGFMGYAAHGVELVPWFVCGWEVLVGLALHHAGQWAAFWPPLPLLEPRWWELSANDGFLGVHPVYSWEIDAQPFGQVPDPAALFNVEEPGCALLGRVLGLPGHVRFATGSSFRQMTALIGASKCRIFALCWISAGP